MITIRRIQLNEGLLYKRIRLASLSDSPDAFATTIEDATKRSLESWNEQADSTAMGADRVTVLAFYDDEPVGVGALYRDDQDPRVGEVVQFWVDPAHRVGPIAAKLITWISDWAETSDYSRLIAWVNVYNRRAIKFYQSSGFDLSDATQPFRPGTDLVSCMMVKRFCLESDQVRGRDKP